MFTNSKHNCKLKQCHNYLYRDVKWCSSLALEIGFPYPDPIQNGNVHYKVGGAIYSHNFALACDYISRQNTIIIFI